jgi:hypothetical protein
MTIIKFKLTRLILFFFIATTLFLNAQDSPPPGFEGFQILIEQDFFSKKYNEDRNYTMGVSLNLLGRKTDSFYFLVPIVRRGIEKLLGITPMFGNKINTHSTFYLACGAFTPLDLEQTKPIVNDRPYASILYLGSRYISVIESDPTKKPYSITSEVNVGLLGTNIGKAVQSYIHEKHIAGSVRPVPRGWHNQISNGGEPTLMYRLQYQQQTFESHWKRPLNNEEPEGEKFKRFQIVTQAESMLGYYTNVAVGAFARFGFFRNPFWDLTGGLGSGSNQNPPAQNKKPVEFYVFGGLRGRLVGYNALLQGQFRKSAHTFSAVKINRLIIEYEWGLVARWRWITLMYEPYVGRSPEYFSEENRQHIWGNFLIRVNWAKDANGNSP